MAQINTSRMLLGGLAAGAFLFVIDGVVNGVILADAWADYQKSIGQSGEFSAGQMGTFGLLSLSAGMLLSWFYAVARPRFGAGPATAIRTGIAAWALAIFIPNAFLIASHAMPSGLLWHNVMVGLIEYVIATLVAGWIYKESN